MICKDIREKLKPFLEDMLKEEEYQNFLGHLEQCPTCKKYVRSIDAFSNQLWQLEDVRAPSDFCSSVFFRLKRSEQESKELESGILKRILMGTFILVLAGVVLFFGVSYLKAYKPSEEKEALTAPSGEGEAEQKPVDDQESSGLNLENGGSEMVEISEEAAADENVGKEAPAVIAVEESLPKEDVIDEEALIVNESLAQENEMIDSIAIPIHWHFQYTEEIDRVKLKDLFQKIKQRKKLLEEKLHKIEEEIFLLEKEKESNQLKLGKPYSNELKTAKLEEEHQKELEIQKKVEEKEQLKTMLEQLEEGKRQVELSQQQKLRDEVHGQAMRSMKIFNTLNILGIMPDYKDDNLSVFRVSAERLEAVREQILSTSQGASSLRDFTDSEAILSRNEALVFMYFQKKGISAFHWHIDLMEPGRMSDLLNMIEAKRTSIDYQSERMIVFSIQREEVENLRMWIKAIDTSFSEFGYLEFKESQLSGVSSGPVKISIFFTKK